MCLLLSVHTVSYAMYWTTLHQLDLWAQAKVSTNEAVWELMSPLCSSQRTLQTSPLFAAEEGHASVPGSSSPAHMAADLTT